METRATAGCIRSAVGLSPVHDPLLASLAAEAGVTRLADLTGLDCIGVPVWHAVRPMSRSLSTHQGKGLTHDQARRGAIMEAIECHHAEQWQAEPADCSGWTARRWEDLPRAMRAPSADDFAVRRGAIDPGLPLDWTIAAPLGDGAGVLVPRETGSLDYTGPATRGVLTTSSGQAAHFDPGAATMAALLELVERDACVEWEAVPHGLRGGYSVDPASLPCPDFAAIVARLEARSIGLRLFRLPAVIDLPVFIAQLSNRGVHSAGHHHVWGSAAAFDPQDAARAALLEALQTRCTVIAGGRDTVPLDLAARGDVPRPAGFALPLAPGWKGHPLDRTRPQRAPHDVPSLIAALHSAGYPQVGRIILSPPTSPAVTVKAYVPGLADEARRRRRP